MKVSGVETCFKRFAICDRFAQCDPPEGSDTAEDELDCEQEYKKKGLVSKKATFRCQSLHHNDESVRASLSTGVVWIMSVPLDGITECWRDEDEQSGAAWWNKFVANIPGDLQRKVCSYLMTLCIFSDTLIYAFVAISMVAGLVSFLKTHYEQKARILSAAAKVVIGLRSLLFSVTRFACIAVFFWPFQGLANHLAHLQAEGFQFDQEILHNLVGSTSYWDRETVDLIYRQQDYTNYTLVTIQAAYSIFFGVILLHGIAIFILKTILSSHFQSATWLNKIGHVIGSLHVPNVYNLGYDSLLKETMSMTFFQMVTNLFFLVPLLVTGGITLLFEMY